MSSQSPDRRAELLERAIRLKKAGAQTGSPQLTSRPVEHESRLGELQQSLWLTHLLAPDSAAYNLATAYRVRGALDNPRLQEAFNEVVARHRILRSSFALEGETVLQFVRPHSPRVIETFEAPEGEGLDLAVQEARRPFDLETGPLIRFLSIDEGSAEESLVVLVLHHILADERSLGILWHELAEAYAGRLSDAEPRLQYDDYVYWQSLRDRGERRQALEALAERLQPLADDLALPLARPTDRTAEARGHLLRRSLDTSVQVGIRRLAAATGASPFMVYSFAFRLLLQRYTSGRPFALATPVSVRSHPAAAEMVGYFLNSVVLNTAVDEGHAVEEAVRDFTQSLRETLAHASVPFHELAEALSPPRRPDRHPIFQTMFVHQEATPSPTFGGFRSEPVTLDLGASKFDLTLFVTEGADTLETAVEYRADHYAERSIGRMLDHYTVLLENLPVDLNRSTAQVPMLPPNEIEQIDRISAGPPLDESQFDLLPRQILQQAKASPANQALVCAGGQRSYGEMERAAHSVASELMAGGIAIGDRVGVFIDRSTELIEAILGCHLAGAAYVPLDPSYPVARNRAVLEDAEVAAVLTTAALRDRIPDGGWKTIDVDRLSPTTSTPEADPELEPETAAYLLYTSGSTGRPKGVVITHGNLRASTAARLQVYDTLPRRFLLLPSISFDSSVAGLFWTLATGGTLAIPTDEQARDPRLLLQLMRDERVTGLLCVPSLYAQLLRLEGDGLQGLETVIVAGESCPPQLIKEHFDHLPRTRLYNEYGPTEATVWATVHEAGPKAAAGPVAIGRPIPGVRVDVLDNRGRPLPVDIPGGAWISGPTVAPGYWRRPELTAERFVADTDSETGRRRYRTGDRMQWTEDGRLLFLGREDEQIKIRGFRIEPGDIEAALLECPGFRQVAVVSRPLVSKLKDSLETAPTGLVAFVETTDDTGAADWRSRLADHLPDFMIPSRLVRLPALPRLPNGKINRQRLRDLEIETEPGIGGSSVIHDTRTQTLLSLWEGLLARQGIALDDNFFELGGHSLLVVELTLAIERDLGVRLAAAEVFENPTVRQLLGLMGRRGETESSPYQHLYPIQPLGRQAPLIVAIPHFFTEMFAQRFRGERPVYGLRGVGLRADGNLGRWRTMQDLGEELLDEIRRRFPEEPCILAGYSFGATMAVETARLMEERGTPAQRLILIAPMPIETYSFGPLRVQLDGLRQSPVDLSPAAALRHYLWNNNPLTRRPYQRAWRWLAIEPWRRTVCSVGRLRKRLGLPLTRRILWADVRVDRFRLHTGYQPRPIRTPTIILNPEDVDTDAAATWRPFFQGPFTVHPTPDPHRGDHSVEITRRHILDSLKELEN